MHRTRRRILLSSYACSPIWGSEPGVGWRWLLELVKLHDVHLVTHEYFREQIEPVIGNSPIAGLTIHYLGAPAFGAHPHTQLNSRLFYVWWQWNLRRMVKKISQTQSFDLFHHLTWGTFRFPSFLGDLNVPFVMGPLGGGDIAPLKFYKGLPFRARFFETIRYLSLKLSRVDPLANWGPRRSDLILCKTDDTINALSAGLRSKAALAFEIGAPIVDLSTRTIRTENSTTFRLLFAGTLTGVKGIVIAVRALALLVEAGYDVTIEIAGKGFLHTHIQSEAERRGVADRVILLGMLPRQELFALYGKADLFIFPSLHDSSGNVVLESLSRGLPVICLDLCGPKYYVTPECGVVVSTKNRSLAEVEQGIADAIASIIDTPGRLEKMSEEAVRQATIQTWESRVSSAYSLIAQRLNWSD